MFGDPGLIEFSNCLWWQHHYCMPFLDHASELLAAYNRSPKNQAYNQIAAQVYKTRGTVGDPLSPQFEVCILKGLIGFDMAHLSRPNPFKVVPQKREWNKQGQK